MLASASDPLSEDLHIYLLGIIPVFVSYGTDPHSSVIFQQEEAKVMVHDANLLRNVDPSFSPSEPDAFNQGWSVSLIIYCRFRVERIMELANFCTSQ